VGHGRVARGASQRVHRLLELRVEIPGVGVVQLLLEGAHLLHELVGVVSGHELRDLVVARELGRDVPRALLHVAEDVLLLVERGFLLQDADGGPGGGERVSVVRLVESRHDPEDAGLAGSVGPDHSDLGPGQEAQRDVVQYDLVAVGLANLLHGVDELSHGSDGSSPT